MHLPLNNRVFSLVLIGFLLFAANDADAQAFPVNTTDCAAITDADIGGSVDIPLSGVDTTSFDVIYNGVTFADLPAGNFSLNNIVGDVQDVIIRAIGANPTDFDDVTCSLNFNPPTCIATQDPDSTVTPVDLGTVITLTLDTTNAISATVDGVPMTPSADPDVQFDVAWEATSTAISTEDLTGIGVNPNGDEVSCIWSINVINEPPTSPDITQPPSGAIVVIEGLETQQFVAGWNESTDPEFDPLTYDWALATDPGVSTVLLSVTGLTDPSVVLSYEAVDQLLDANGVNVGGSITLFHRATASDGNSTTPGTPGEVTLTRGVVSGPVPTVTFPVPLLSPAGLAALLLMMLLLAAARLRGQRSLKKE